MPEFIYNYNFVYILVIAAFFFALIASWKVKSTFKKYSKSLTHSGMTGAKAAERILLYNGVYDVEIEQISGKLSDHYDPSCNTIRLSYEVYNSTSTAAIGVACHEAGHAVQYARDYSPIKFRSLIIPITNIGSRLSMPLILIGIVFSSVSNFMIAFAYIGIICFALSVVFQLVTLPVEFNASRRAVVSLRDSGLMNSDELRDVRKVLTAAAMTYVAALAVAVTQLLRLLAIVGRRK